MKATRTNFSLFALAALLTISPLPFFAQTTSENPAAITSRANVPPGAAQVIKMADANVSQDVILAYIRNSREKFNLSSDDLVYLRDVGIPNELVTAMIDHDKDFRGEAPATAAVEAPLVPTTTPSPDVVANAPQDVNYFYDALSPYGTWLYVDQVGWCWQPNTAVVDTGWQPYCDAGRWEWTDCGWYWASDYSWGWAPFHYGRWWRSPRCGWVWCPGTRWAPSWVTWRVHDDFCGWAPLPPGSLFVGSGFEFNGVFVGLNFDFGLPFDCFTFVGFHDFLGRDFRRHRLHDTRVRQSFRSTTVVNNFVSGSNNTVINNGISTTRISRATGTTIRRTPVVDSPRPLVTANATAIPATRLVQDGRTTAVVRTPLPSPTATVTARAQRVTDRQQIKPAVSTLVSTHPARPSTRLITPPESTANTPFATPSLQPGGQRVTQTPRIETLNTPEVRTRTLPQRAQPADIAPRETPPRVVAAPMERREERIYEPSGAVNNPRPHVSPPQPLEHPAIVAPPQPMQVPRMMSPHPSIEHRPTFAAPQAPQPRFERPSAGGFDRGRDDRPRR